MKKLWESRQQFYGSLCKEWGSVTQNTSMVSGTLKTKAKHQTHSFPSAFHSHTAHAMEKGWFRARLPTRAITQAFEALVSGADGSFHPRSVKTPKGLGGVCKVTLLLWHLRWTDSWIRHDAFLERAAKQPWLGTWRCKNTENWWSLYGNGGKVRTPSSFLWPNLRPSISMGICWRWRQVGQRCLPESWSMTLTYFSLCLLNKQ